MTVYGHSTGVHAYLVTCDFEARMSIWSASALYANWLEGRQRDPKDNETWQVMVMDDQAERFLETAKKLGNITVEEIVGMDGYDLKVGEPGTGWKRV